MIDRYVLLTNNSTFAPKAGVDLEVIEGGAFDVFTCARSRILTGCRLLNHPLYGNFTPRQQPFRSLLLSCPKGEHGKKTDNTSYQMIETALERYGSRIHNLPGPEDYPESVRNDYAYLDRTLIEEVLLSFSGRR
ncbi:MAG: GrdX family protein [Thermovirgaceae bacterium]